MHEIYHKRRSRTIIEGTSLNWYSSSPKGCLQKGCPSAIWMLLRKITRYAALLFLWNVSGGICRKGQHALLFWAHNVGMKIQVILFSLILKVDGWHILSFIKEDVPTHSFIDTLNNSIFDDNHETSNIFWTFICSLYKL